MTATSDLIESLISYSWDDWQVTRQEARRVIAAIRNDNVPDATIAALDKSGSLIKLFQRVGPPELARSLIASIAGRTTMQRYQARNALIRSLINNPLGTQTDNWIYFPTITFFDICADLADAAGRLGFAAAGATGVASQAIQGPFSGVGATGVNPTDLPSIAFGDQLKLLNKDPATVTKYSNPLGDLGAYLSQLSPQDKLNQAQTLVGQPISTLFPDAYPGNPPSRAKVMSAAARKYDLTPQLIGAIILAEQRDQTRDEDAKDYQAAVSIKSANTSIGLGQVVVSTAIKYELFTDLLGQPVRRGLSRKAVPCWLPTNSTSSPPPVTSATSPTWRRNRTCASCRRPAVHFPPSISAPTPAIRATGRGTMSARWPRNTPRVPGTTTCRRAGRCSSTMPTPPSSTLE